jgi:hypothetical protein
MSIYGTCKKCGNETKDYECTACLRIRVRELESELASLRAAHANCPVPVFDGLELTAIGRRIIAEQRAASVPFVRRDTLPGEPAKGE